VNKKWDSNCALDSGLFGWVAWAVRNAQRELDYLLWQAAAAAEEDLEIGGYA